VCKSTSLLLVLVLALKALQPEPTQFGFDLAFPRAFLFGISLRLWRDILGEGSLLEHILAWAFNNCVKRQRGAFFRIGVHVATL
jgi:hypothetical protein